MNAQEIFMQTLIEQLKKWNEETKAKGLIPTVELLIEELENHDVR